MEEYYQPDKIYLIAGIGSYDALYESREKYIGIRGYFSESNYLGGRWSAGIFSPVQGGKDLVFDKVRFELDQKLKDTKRRNYNEGEEKGVEKTKNVKRKFYKMG